MNFREDLRKRATARGGHVVLAEGWDERVRAAADAIEGLGMASVTVLDRTMARDARLPAVADHLRARRPDKVPSDAHARELAEDPIRFAAALLGLGQADAAVAGATCPTADVVRAGLLALGPAEGIRTVSSAFYIAIRGDRIGALLDERGDARLTEDAVFTFTDAGVVPDPTSDQLAEIAVAAARDRRRIVGDEPLVAFLSYSTKGSADGKRVEHVRAGLERFRQLAPEIPSDGELQGDAALVPGVADGKAPGSPVAGRANVLVFPDLDSGNIAYKLVQRLGNARAAGPILQGLARPLMDLSRGATADDIVDVAAIGLLKAVPPA